METNYALYEKDANKKIARITFNAPERLNSASTADWQELNALVREAQLDDDVKVIIFKGAGRAFGTGANVKDLGPHHGWDANDLKYRPPQRRRLAFDKHVVWGRDGFHQAVLFCDKPTIAQVHGYCYGGHMYIAQACDLTIASEDALFAHPGYRYIGPTGEIVLAILTIGVKKAKDFMFTGRAMDAKEALECGLISRVVPLEKLEAVVNETAEVIATQAMDALVIGKSLFELALDILGVGTGYTAGYIGHVLQTNIHYEPGEFNLFKAKRHGGIKEAFREREELFGKAPIVRKD